MLKFSKFVVVVLAFAMLASFVPAKAQTMTNEQMLALINQLTAQIAALQAQLAGGGSTGGASHTYTVDLTLGSKGADVTALQQFLVSKNFLTMPAGAAYGYFGNLTKAALASYQQSVGISPAVGYFGPITRAHFNAMVVVSTAPVVSGAPVVSSGPLTGGEAVMTVDTNATPAAGQQYYEGDSNVGLLGLKIKAQNGDLAVQRVKVNIGTSVTFYTKAFTTLSLYDGSTLLGSVTLDSNSVVKEGTSYFVYFTGMNVVVRQDETKVLTLKGSLMGTISASYRSQTIIIPANGVRAVDAVGLDIQGPSSLITRTITISGALTDTAQLIMSKSSNSPAAANLISDSQGELTEATVGVFDFKSKNDLVKVDQVVLTVGTTATPTAAFLYDGSSLISSASVSSNSATFTDLEDTFQIPKNTTKSVIVKITYTDVNATAATTSVSISPATNVTAYNSEGVAITGGNLSGTPLSETMTLLSQGPIISLGSATASKFTTSDIAVASSSITGTIVLNVEAAGDDVYFTSGTTTAALLNVYNGDTAMGAATSTNVSFSSAFQAESSPTTSYKLPEGQSGTITITGIVPANGGIAGNFINFRLSGAKWGSTETVAAAGTTSTTLDATVYKTSPLLPLP